MTEWTQITVGHTIRPKGILTSPASSGMVLQPNKLNPTDLVFTSGSDPPGWAFDDNRFIIDASGAEEVDLTDLTDVEGVALDGTNMKLQVLRVQCPSTNSALIGVKDATVSGYPLGVSISNIAVPCNVGGVLLMIFNDQLSDITAGRKALRFTGTEDDVFTLDLVIG